MKKIKVETRLGRYMSSNTLYLKIEDKASGSEFLSLEFDADQLANLMNQSCAHMEGEVRGLQFVGKKKIEKPFDLEIPNNINKYQKNEIELYLKEFKEDFEEANPGWFLDIYIGSKSSVSSSEDKTIAHLTQYTFVEEG